MKIRGFRSLFGPNVHSDKPLIGMLLDLEDYAERPSSTFPGFPQRLAARLPGLIEHRCSRDRRGGFLERLHEGTYLGHVCEHVALEFSELAGIPVHFGRTVSTELDHVYLVLVAFENEAAMHRLLEASVAFVQAAIDDQPFDLTPLIDAARDDVTRTAMGPSTRCIVEAARARGIPTRPLKDCLVQLGWGVNRRFIDAALTSLTSQIAVDVASDKALTKEMLSEAYIPVPAGLEVHSETELLAAFRDFAPPVVIKPVDGNQGKGVSLNISTEEDALTAYFIAREISRTIMLEEQFFGRDYRVLVVDGRIVAASERVPAHVIGDGQHSIAELVEIANRDPRRGSGHEKPLTRLELDPVTLCCLKRRGLDVNHVPLPGGRVSLRENANLSTGGEAHDVTASVHPSIAALCARAAQIIGLDIAGIDVVTGDISRPLQAGEGIVEVNAAPGLRMHVHPSLGEPIAVGDAIIDWLFPRPQTGRIPIAAITGTNGKTTTARLLAHIVSSAGKRVGLTSTDGICIGNECLGHADATGPHSANTVLSDPTVEVAVLETARGGLLRRGLAFDWCDVAVITNIRPDHIGQDGIRDLDDLIWIKSLIAERVREGGTLIINADDPGALAVLDRERVRRVPKDVVMFSETANNPAVRDHLARSGFALLVEGEHIVEAFGPARRRLIAVREIPITMSGVLSYNVGNCMAALAASIGLEIPLETAVTAIRTFTARENPGRGNVYSLRGAYVMLDYGHNADAFAAVGRLHVRSRGRLLGVIAVPGDRAHEIISSAGRTAAEVFDQIFVREDDDLRGRPAGETAALLCRAIREVRPDMLCDHVRGGEVQALMRAVECMRPGDLTVIFYEHLAPLVAALESMQAEPVDPATFAARWTLAPAIAS